MSKTNVRASHLFKNLWDKLKFSCGIAQYEKKKSIFQQLSGSIKKTLRLEGRPGTRLQFYEALRFSWLFLIFWDPKSGNSNIPCLLLIIKLRFTCGEKKIW